jgi:hypothetical protein
MAKKKEVTEKLFVCQLYVMTIVDELEIPVLMNFYDDDTTELA